VKVPSGDYIYQVTGVEDARVPLLEECIEKVTEMAGMEKGRELALELLEDWKRRIEAEEATRESLAGAGNYTIRTTEPLGRRENAKLKFDDKPLSLIVARPILQAGFEIGTPGWLAEPISQEGQNEAYLVRLKEIHPPEMDLYESRRFQLESTILQRKRTALLNEYNRDLTKRADPRVFSAPVSDDG
ncbi:MAG: hypothetical protein ACE5GW_08500, partial [Planctomycetota bacterium]